MRIIDNILGFGGHGHLDPSYVCIHETAGPGAPAINLVSWWEGGGGYPVHYCGDWTGDCYYCVPEDEVCWQVGNGNAYVVGIELCHATNESDFQAVWNLGVEWAAWQLSKRGWGVDRLISHDIARQWWGGTDHTDPVGYFAEFGRTWDDFVNDVDKYLKGEYGGSFDMAEALFYVKKGDNCGYKVNDIVYFNAVSGFKWLSHIDQRNIIRDMSPGIAEIDSTPGAPWLMRASQVLQPDVRKATYGVRTSD
jgi:hypothetical protein